MKDTTSHHAFAADAGHLSKFEVYKLVGRSGTPGIGLLFLGLRGEVKAEVALNLDSARELIKDIQIALEGERPV